MKPDVSLVVTTYGGETYHTQHCLGWLRRWKQPSHEIIVVCHDETPLLRGFLVLCQRIGLIDQLIFAVPSHGHVRGVNLGISRASADVVFNLCVDMRIGKEIVEECAARLRSDEGTGVIGWHYDWSQTFEGTFWRGAELEHALRKYDDSRVAGELDAEHVANIRAAPWFTGRVFEAIGTRRILCFNGSFFGVRRDLWERLGGFDELRYPVHWADDFFQYAVLDQGLSVANIPGAYRCGARPEAFQALTDLGWQGREDPLRGQDRIDWNPSRAIAGLGNRETVFLELTERCLDDSSSVAVFGEVPWTPKRGVRATAAEVTSQRFDLVLCASAAYEPAVLRRVRKGGMLIVFQPHDSAALQAVGTLGVYRHEAERLAFARTSAQRM
jgi:GT2 family glycosyltransferase